MKLTMAIVVQLVIGIGLGWGILELMRGAYWPLLTGLIIYTLAFARIGCAEH